jgi:acyl dehydratase
MSNCRFDRAKDELYFEDYQIGCIYDLGSIGVDEAEIIEFAGRYDPQPFHIDPERAKSSVYGGLIASGWHTSCLMMRLLVDHFVSSASSLGSPGVDELRWLKPVRPGDVLSAQVTIIDAKRSRSKPGRGIIQSFIEVSNAEKETVMTMKAVNLMLCREPAAMDG